MPLQSGQTLGPYTIISQIGHGEMADVYHASQPSIGRESAVKVPNTLLMEQDPTIHERFLREATILARLEHPHIVPVLDFGEQDGSPYIVMSLLTGGILAGRIHDLGPMSVEEITLILRQLASALDYAHKFNIIHCDFNPANVLFDKRGNSYLAGFGLARIIGGPDLTASVGMVGTPDYMAPEWAKEGEITHSVDIYALGVTLYQLLAGHVPFHASTPMDTLTAHINEPVPNVCAVREDLPAAMHPVIVKAMGKKPEERYLSAGELAQAFESAFAQEH